MSASYSSPGGEATPSAARAVILVFLPFAAGFFFSDLYRQINAIIAPQLVGELGLTAAGLGLLTSVFFLAFTANQLPLGIMLDRFGPRRVQASHLLVAALGAVIFSFGDSQTVLLIGRALIGFGVSGGLMSGLKAITIWFPRERWPLANGCILGMGALGAMTATAPVETLLQVTDWRGVFLGCAVATVIVSLAIFFIVPEKPVAPSALKFSRQLADLRRIFGDREFWRYTPITVTGVAGAMSIQGLWAGPWMKDVGGLERDTLAAYLLANTASMAVGVALGGLVTDRLARVGIGLPRVLGVSVVLSLTAQVMVIVELDRTGVWPWILFGLFGHMTVLSYAHLSRYFPIEFAGRANTSLNLVVFAGVFLVQYGMGVIINAFPLEADGGYAHAGYRAAFAAALGLQVVAFLWFLIPTRAGITRT